LRVGWDPARQEYIIRAPGGHIIGATSDGEAVLEAIRFESEWGFGSMELRLQGCQQCQTHHGLRQAATRPPVLIKNARAKPKPAEVLHISLEDLGLA
jgi:hypothetical protein